MSSQASDSKAYSDLKLLYDALLDKHQNDLIKIKQTQKLIDARLQQSQAQHAVQLQAHLDRIASLEAQLANQLQPDELMLDNGVTGRQGLIVEANEGAEQIEGLKGDIRSLMDENIVLTSEHTMLKIEAEKVRISYIVLKDQVQIERGEMRELKSDLAELKAKQKTIQTQTIAAEMNTEVVVNEELLKLESKHRTGMEQYKQLDRKNEMLREKVQELTEQMKRNSDRERKQQNLLRKKQHQLVSCREQIDKMQKSRVPRKKTENTSAVCQECDKLKQENELLKGMVKSTHTLSRVHEMEAERYKNHLDPAHRNPSKHSVSEQSEKFKLPSVRVKK